MSRQLVLISHGKFCEELKNSTEMIMGPQENIYTIPLLPEDGADTYKERFLLRYSTIKRLRSALRSVGRNTCKYRF